LERTPENIIPKLLYQHKVKGARSSFKKMKDQFQFLLLLLLMMMIDDDDDDVDY
jgi:hypothetical protein